MDNWKEFVFNEPYAGGSIGRINNVILLKQYVNFIKNIMVGEAILEKHGLNFILGRITGNN